MSAAFRDLAGPRAAERPVLTWWQRVLVRWLPAWRLPARGWYRAHVGGAWERRCHLGLPGAPETWVAEGGYAPSSAVVVEREVYPYPELGPRNVGEYRARIAQELPAGAGRACWRAPRRRRAPGAPR